MSLTATGKSLLESLEHYRNHNAWLSRAVEQTADAILITNDQALIEYVNPAFEAITGYTAAEALGRNPNLIKSGLHDRQFYARLWETLSAGGPFRGTIINRRKSGELFWAEQTITPIKDDSGRITHYVSLMRDVTEERRLREQEFFLRVARTVQQRFCRFEEQPRGYEVAGSIHPAALTGGDYFDVIPHPDGRLTIAIGDVSGHGFGAALLMAETRAYVRAFSAREPGPKEVLECVNRALIGDLDGSQFVTLLLVRLDPDTRTFEYASAGHVPGYLLDSAGQVTMALQSTGPPLGLFSAAEFSSSGGLSCQGAGMLVLLTDGITEAASPGGEEFTAGRALAVAHRQRAQPAREIADAICAAAREFRGGPPADDDMTAVVGRLCS